MSHTAASARPTEPLTARVDAVDWPAVADGLDDAGIASIGSLLTVDECRELVLLYDSVERFRSSIDMARHRFGEGKYRYFAHPLPDAVTDLRAALWPHLLPIAREWASRREQPSPWPDGIDDWLDQCHAAGQGRPTPLLLRYGPGDWNALHRDVYGELVFPLQVVIGLDEPDVDYTGGELVVVEQRPRAQSRATSTTISQGHGLVLTTRDRPSGPPAAGPTAPCATASAWSVPGGGMRSASSSTTPNDHGIGPARSRVGEGGPGWGGPAGARQ